jgi:hypothetical protein
MSSPEANAPLSALHEILKWSNNRPLWQRDALRRLVLYGQITAADVEELVGLCKSHMGVDGVAPNDAVPFSADHLPADHSGGPSVSLARVSGLQNVANLLDDQHLVFGPAPGLCIIFGENGAGKSGYCRVLKRGCRARGTPQSIKGNAFDSTQQGVASADIILRIDGVETTIRWQDGVPSDPRLAHMFVFDGVSATYHVTEDGPASFIPNGLEILPKLAQACDNTKAQLKAEIETVSSSIQLMQANAIFRRQTEVGRFLKGLNEKTDSIDVEKAAEIPASSAKRLGDLTEALRSDPKQKAQATLAAVDRIRSFSETVECRDGAIGDGGIADVCARLKEQADATAAAALVAKFEFDETYLPGTGNGAWRRLWDIARLYAEKHAYPGQTFPVEGDRVQCVLCQQTLEPEAMRRFTRFDEYVRDEARVRAENARARVTELSAAAAAWEPLRRSFDKVAADIAVEGSGAREAIEAYVADADARLMLVQECLRTGATIEPLALPAVPKVLLDGIANALTSRAAMEQSADDEEKRSALTLERDELEDREWLSRHKAEILDLVTRMKRLALLKRCEAQTSTNTLTLKNNELHEAIVTATYCSRFAKECEALGLKTLPVQLESIRGSKGVRRFGVRIEGAANSKVVDVASDGEHRCIALAAYLAELSQASHSSALILDDPVSSVDHHRRAAIAKRLVQEAKNRQVIIFTHDLAFVCDLATYAAESRVPVHEQYIDRSATQPGRCHDGFPWEGQTHRSQMKTLRELCAKADRMFREQGQAEYRAFALTLCDLIRSAAERVIEEELFNHVLRRHESRIQVGKLESVSAVEPADYKAVFSVWKACSELTPSHSASRARQPAIPDPKALTEYVTTLEQTVLAVKGRRQAASKATSMPAVSSRPASTGQVNGHADGTSGVAS